MKYMQSVLVCFIIFSLVSTSVYSVDLTHIIPDFFNRITGLPIYRTTPIPIRYACIGEGRSIPTIANPPSCCPGLRLIRPKSPGIIGSYGICTAKCGNGVCDSATESSYNCPQDCKGECGWCGLECVRKSSGMICPTIAPPEGYECKEINGVCKRVRNYEKCIGDGKIVRKLGYVYGECCEGLHEIASGYKNGVVYCTSEVCGNGKCTALENEWNCPQDCEKACIKEGGRGTRINDKCCKGLTPIAICFEKDGDCACARTPKFYCTKCGDGVCKSPENKCNCPQDCGHTTTTIPKKCYDSDGGRNYYVKGTVIDKYGHKYTDHCQIDLDANASRVIEFYCLGNQKVGVDVHTCPNGCIDGVCIGTPTTTIPPICKDSDGGRNYYVKGTTRGLDKYGKYVTKTDSCMYCSKIEGYSETCFGLREYYCSNGRVVSTIYNCGCRNGACIRQRDYVDIFIKPKIQYVDLDERAKYVITVQDKHPRSAESVTENEAQTVSERLYTYSLEVNSDSELKMNYDKEIILSAGEKKDIKLYAYAPHSEEGAKYRIKAIVYSNSESDVRDHAEASLIVRPIPRMCTDSDGGKNFYKRGTVVGLDKSGRYVRRTDRCVFATQLRTKAGIVDSQSNELGKNETLPEPTLPEPLPKPDISRPSLIEYYCRGNNVAFVVHTCKNGCINGACMQQKDYVDILVTPKYRKTTVHTPVEYKIKIKDKHMPKPCPPGQVCKTAFYTYNLNVGAKRRLEIPILIGKTKTITSSELPFGEETNVTVTLPHKLIKINSCVNDVVSISNVGLSEIKIDELTFYLDNVVVNPDCSDTVLYPRGIIRCKLKNSVGKVLRVVAPGSSDMITCSASEPIPSISFSYPRSIRLLPGQEKTITLKAVSSEEGSFIITTTVLLSNDEKVKDSDRVTFSVYKSESCTDSDGGRNYYVKGYVDDVVNGRFYDQCYTLHNDKGDPYVVLIEQYCENNRQKEEYYECPNGCEDGACVKNETVCTDSDGGKNYFIRGKTSGLDKDGKYVERTDNCMAIAPQCKPGGECPPAVHYVEEYYCYNNRVVSDMFECPNGCDDGACIGTPTTTITIPPTVTIVTTTQPEVDPTELLDITIKLEQAIIKVRKVRNTVEAIADYYESIGSEEAKKWRKAVNLLNEIQERLGKAKEDLKDVKTRDQLNAVKIKVEDAYNLIEEVIRIILYS